MAAPCNLLAPQAWVGEINLRDCEGIVLQHGSGNRDHQTLVGRAAATKEAIRRLNESKKRT